MGAFRWTWGVAALVAVGAGTAGAQGTKLPRVALGANITSRLAGGNDVGGSTHPGFEWRIGEGGPGWGWKFGLNWFSAHIDRPLGGTTVELGELHVRPLLGGYGYTHIVRNFAISYNLLGGYAFGKFEIDEGAKALFQSYYGHEREVQTRARNTFVLKPEVSAWRNLTRKVSLHTAVSYVVARPEVTLETAAGVDTRRIRADMLQLKIGAVYSIF